MTVNFGGNVYDDAGSAVSGASVKLLETGTTTQEGSTVTTDSAGRWDFSEADQDRYDVEITKGSSVRRIKWSDEISLQEIDVRNNTGATTPAATFTNLTNNIANQVAVFSGANSTKADGDEIYLSFKLHDSAGNLDEFARMTVEATDVTTTTEDGQIRFGVIVAGTLTDVFTINSTTGGAAEISYEVDSFTIKGGEGEAGVLYLFADQGDDAGDEWKVNIADGGVLTIGNDIASAGTYVTHFTVTPHATITSSSVTLPGILDVNGSVDWDVSDVQVDSSGDIDLVSTGNSAAAIYLRENAGTSGTIKIHADQGTSVTEGAESINILSDAGGVGIRSTANLAKAINITSDGGTTGSIAIFNDQGSSVTEGAESISLLSDAGGVGIRSTANLAKAVNITSDGGTTGSISIFNDQGTSVTEGAESISLLSDAGGIGIRSTANLANAVNLTVDGGSSSTMTLFNDQGTAATEGAASIQLLSDVGGINVKSGLNGAGAILLTADGGTSETIVVHADRGTGTGSIELLSDAGGIEIDAGTDIILDAGGADIFLKDDGTLFGTLTNSSGELVIKSSSSGTTAATFSGANVTLAGTVGSGAITSSGIIKTDDATEATSTTDGSLQTDGGLSVVKDAVFGDDIFLLSDSSVFNMGAGNDFTITHDGTTGATLAGNPITITSGGAATWSTSAGALTITSAAAATWSTAAGALTIDGDDGITLQTTGSGNVTVAEILDITDATDSSDASGDTGALRTEGGASIAKKLFVGTDLEIANGNLIVADGHGIDFSANTEDGTDTSELLDDYEEGTFTPGIADSSLDGSGESQEYARQVGRYVKIGNRVHFQLQVETSSIGSLTTSQGCNIVGLPFTASSATDNVATASVGYGLGLNITAGQGIGAYVGDNTSYVGMHLWDASAGSTTFLVSEFSSNGRITVAGMYEV